MCLLLKRCILSEGVFWQQSVVSCNVTQLDQWIDLPIKRNIISGVDARPQHDNVNLRHAAGRLAQDEAYRYQDACNHRFKCHGSSKSGVILSHPTSKLQNPPTKDSQLQTKTPMPKCDNHSESICPLCFANPLFPRATRSIESPYWRSIERFYGQGPACLCLRIFIPRDVNTPLKIS
jgi:hypothetical protein